MKTSKLILGIATSVIILSSCSVSIHKRQHGKGYFITSTKKIKAPNTTVRNEKIEETQVAKHEEIKTSTPILGQPTVIASVEKHSIENNIKLSEVSTKEIRNNNTVVIQAKQNSLAKEKMGVTKIFSSLNKNINTEVDTDEKMVLLVILAIFLSPVAVYIKTGGATSQFWIDLIAWLIGISGFWFFQLAGLAMLFAIVYALLIVFDII
ncbi:MAG: YqaE/Pmp3 family membrane protein [Bacteroidia bacterium]